MKNKRLAKWITMILVLAILMTSMPVMPVLAYEDEVIPTGGCFSEETDSGIVPEWENDMDSGNIPETVPAEKPSDSNDVIMTGEEDALEADADMVWEAEDALDAEADMVWEAEDTLDADAIDMALESEEVIEIPEAGDGIDALEGLAELKDNGKPYRGMFRSLYEFYYEALLEVDPAYTTARLTAQGYSVNDAEGQAFYVYLRQYAGEEDLGALEVRLPQSSWNMTGYYFAINPRTDRIVPFVYLYDKTLDSVSANAVEIITGTEVTRDLEEYEEVTAELEFIDASEGMLEFSLEKNISGWAPGLLQPAVLLGTSKDSESWEEWEDMSYDGGGLRIYGLEGGTQYYGAVFSAHIVNTVDRETEATFPYIIEFGPYEVPEDSEIDMQTAFPDDNFRAYIYGCVHKTEADKVFQSDLNQITSVTTTRNNISDFAGLDLLHNLQRITCQYEPVKNLDSVHFEKLARLWNVYIRYCELEKFPDLSKTDVSSVSVHYNRITTPADEIAGLLPDGYMDLAELKEQINDYQLTEDVSIEIADAYYFDGGKAMVHIVLDSFPDWKNYQVYCGVKGGTAQKLTRENSIGYTYCYKGALDEVTGEGAAELVVSVVEEDNGAADSKVVVSKENKVDFVKAPAAADLTTVYTGAVPDIYEFVMMTDGTLEKTVSEIAVVSPGPDGSEKVIAGMDYKKGKSGKKDLDYRYQGIFRNLIIPPSGTVYWNVSFLWNPNLYEAGEYDVKVTYDDGSSYNIPSVIIIKEGEVPSDLTVSEPDINYVKFASIYYNGDEVCNLNGYNNYDDYVYLKIYGYDLYSVEDGRLVSEVVPAIFAGGKELETEIEDIKLPTTSYGEEDDYGTGIILKLKKVGWGGLHPGGCDIVICDRQGKSLYRDTEIMIPYSRSGVYQFFFNSAANRLEYYFDSRIKDGAELSLKISEIDLEDFDMDEAKPGRTIIDTTVTVKDGRADYYPNLDGEQINLLYHTETGCVLLELTTELGTFRSYQRLTYAEVYEEDEGSTLDFGYFNGLKSIFAGDKTYKVSGPDMVPNLAKDSYEVKIYSTGAAPQLIASGNLQQTDAGSDFSAELDIEGKVSAGNAYDVNIYMGGICISSWRFDVYDASEFCLDAYDKYINVSGDNTLFLYTRSTISHKDEYEITFRDLSGAVIGTVKNPVFYNYDDEGYVYEQRAEYQEFQIKGVDLSKVGSCCYVKITRDGKEPKKFGENGTASEEDYYENEFGKIYEIVGRRGQGAIRFVSPEGRICGIEAAEAALPVTVKISRTNDTDALKTITVTESSYRFTQKALKGLDVQNGYYDISAFSGDRAIFKSNVRLDDGTELKKDAEVTNYSNRIFYVITKGGRIEDKGNGVTLSGESNGTLRCGFNQSLNFSVVPVRKEDHTYYIQDVLIDGTSIGAYEQFSINNVKQPHIVIVKFTENESEAVAKDEESKGVVTDNRELPLGTESSENKEDLGDNTDVPEVPSTPPTVIPTPTPTPTPSEEPSTVPSEEPSAVPSEEPSAVPSEPPVVYKVSFGMQGHGAVIENQLATAGEKIAPPAEPTEAGWKFEGWYKDAACTLAWDFAADVVVSDTVLYAKWTQITETPEDIDDSRVEVEKRTDLGAVGASIGAVKPKTYDGAAYLPSVKVTALVGGKTVTLTEGTDYRVLYENNINAGTGLITVKGNGNYIGTITAPLTINKKSIKKLKVMVGGVGIGYTGKLPVYIYDGSTLLTEGDDYAVSFEAGLTQGSGKKTITITAADQSNYCDSIATSLVVYDTDKILSENDVKLEYEEKEYEGKALKPRVTVTYEGAELDKSCYTVKYVNNKNAGCAYVTVTGKKGYGGSVIKTFEIKPLQKVLEVKPIPDKAYNGKLQKPKVKVSADGKLLKEGRDYKVVYTNNLHAVSENQPVSDDARAKVTVIGIGNYADAKAQTGYFTILPLKISKASVKMKAGTLTVSYAKRVLTEGIDYQVSYDTPQTGKVTIEGIGDFTGSVEKKGKRPQ